MTPDSAVVLHADQSAQATRTTAQVQHANASGLPMMIPGTRDVRHRTPRSQAPLGVAYPPSRQAPLGDADTPALDRGRIAHEWEGGGAPEMRGAGPAPWAVTTWLNRLLHGSRSTSRPAS